jgi:DNA-binding Xre family transcriptional regulator
MKRRRHIGSGLDEFLAEEGILEQVSAVAQKRVLAWQLFETMRKRKVSKAQMAKRMRTSRAALDRLLDPDNASVTLATMGRAAAALGKRLRIDLVDGVSEKGSHQ